MSADTDQHLETDHDPRKRTVALGLRGWTIIVLALIAGGSILWRIKVFVADEPPGVIWVTGDARIQTIHREPGAPRMTDFMSVPRTIPGFRTQPAKRDVEITVIRVTLPGRSMPLFEPVVADWIYASTGVTKTAAPPDHGLGDGRFWEFRFVRRE